MDRLRADVDRLGAEISDIKGDLRDIATFMRNVAVQEERVLQIIREIKFLRATETVQEQKFAEIYKIHGQCACASGAVADNIIEIEAKLEGVKSKLSDLKQSHDRCSIESVKTEISWLKWFVMGNSVAILGAIAKSILTH